MKTLIVAKSSKFEWEQHTLNLNPEELKTKLTAENANLDRILKSHDYQVNTREIFKEIFNDSKLVMMHEVKNKIQGYDLVIVLGGDNSFTNVSHFVGDTPIIGINSDPERSVGSLTQWLITSPHDVFALKEHLDFNEFTITKWFRLEATIDGKLITSATSEYFFGERQRNNMSRHILVYEGIEYEQKCSGLIVATGAGSSGWFKSAAKHYVQWEPNRPLAGFVATEMYSGSCNLGFLDTKKRQSIKIHSLNDGEGLVSVDSWEEYPFIRGSTAEVYISEPLNVITIDTMPHIGEAS